MILVVVGTSPYRFDRLLTAVDRCLVRTHTNERLVAQTGATGYVFSYQNTLVYPELKYEELVGFVVKARLIIAHGGAGTLLLCMRYAKHMPIVVPRAPRHHEHVDDHQSYFAAYLEKRGLVTIPQDADELSDAMSRLMFSENKLPRHATPHRDLLIENLCKNTAN